MCLSHNRITLKTKNAVAIPPIWFAIVAAMHQSALVFVLVLRLYIGTNGMI